MSWKHIFVWTCDICLCQVEKNGYGFAKDWTYFLLRDGVWSEIQHSCSSCRTRFKLKQVDTEGKVEASQVTGEQLDGYKDVARG